MPPDNVLDWKAGQAVNSTREEAIVIPEPTIQKTRTVEKAGTITASDIAAHRVNVVYGFQNMSHGADEVFIRNARIKTLD